MSIKQHFHPGSYRDIFIWILFLACFCCKAQAQNIQVETSLDKASMPIGAQTVLHVSAHIPAKSVISFPLLKDSIGKIKIVKGPKADTTVDKNNAGSKTITHNYTITSFDTGVYIIPQLEFHSNSGVLETTPLTLHIRGILVDTTKSFYDIKQPFVVSYNFWDWLKDHWVLVLIILAGIGLVIGVIYYLKNRPEKVIIKKAAPILSADVIAINKLYELRDKKLWQQDQIKLYYIELTDILREYLEARYRIQAHEQTTADILAALKKQVIPADARNSLKQLLTLADLVKFAKEKPSSAENEQSMEDAIHFINQTREHIPPVDAKEELPG
ncbi:MAG TPA: hypothetical protein VGM63_18245 [Mucilaginibacter sp.]